MRNILVIGGSGFVGSAIVRRLSARGERVTVVTRRRERARALVLLPNVEVVEGDVHDDATLARLVAGRDAVINLVGILHGDRGVPYGRAFAKAHVELPRRVAGACATAGVPRLLHMSALGASPTGPSMYQRSKGDGEAAVRDHAGATAWTMFRPSVVFGRDDSFLNLFADMQAIAPFVPVGGADAKLQPVHVEDVAEAFAVALDLKAAHGRIYDLVGPRVYTLRELIEFAGRAAGHPRSVIALPEALARLQAWSMECLPGAPLSRDNLDSLKVDNVSREGIAPELGIVPAEMEPLAMQWLGTQCMRERLMRLRQRAGR
jgi:NADH dehydrogenase